MDKRPGKASLVSQNLIGGNATARCNPWFSSQRTNGYLRTPQRDATSKRKKGKGKRSDTSRLELCRRGGRNGREEGQDGQRVV